MRLFAGIALPIAVQDRLSSLQLRWASPQDGLRWATAAQWHIHLRYVGELGADQVSACQSAIMRLAHPSVEVSIEQLGRFAAKGLLYAAVERTPALLSLQQAVEQSVALYAEPASPFPFHPHITLARSKGKAGMRSLEKLATPELPSIGAPLRWKAQEVQLYESVAGLHGTEFIELQRIPLSARVGSVVT